MRTATAERVEAPAKANPLKLAIAFACVYVIWGSTYLAIRFAVETLPPLWMAGSRFLIAGALLYAWVSWRGRARRPTRAQWKASALLGGLFFLGGNGGVCWAEQRVPSGLTALLVATVPFWMVVLDWARRNGVGPSRRSVLGLVLGFLGVALLLGSGSGGRVDPAGAAILLVATLSWAAGSIHSRYAPHPSNHLQSTAMQMVAGGILLLVAGVLRGEWAALDAAKLSLRSIASLAYLILFGSLVGFSAYNWLLQATTPARVSTYAFVNPIVAVFLGWALAGEAITPRTILAGTVIVLAVSLIIGNRARAKDLVDRIER